MRASNLATDLLSSSTGSRNWFSGSYVLLGLLCFAVLLPLLVVAPYWFPPDPTGASASARIGYNNSLAHALAVLWAVACVAAFALLERAHRPRSQVEDANALPSHAVREIGTNPRGIAELALVFSVVLVLYWPAFLSRYGPYMEDVWLLTVVQRMLDGQRPYVDFEAPYGPIMLYVPYFWMKLIGYSMASYYALIAVVEALQFTAIAAALQRIYPDFRTRLAVFILSSAFLVNTLLALSWNGTRRLLPLMIILLVASRPASIRRVSIAAVLLGLLGAYSHEYAAATAVAVAAIYGLILALKRPLFSLLPVVLLGTISMATWTVVSFALLGTGFLPYMETRVLISVTGSTEMGFPFYWTVNSLGIFGLLFLGSALVGRGLGSPRVRDVSTGDLLLWAGLIYALMALKFGLNRADCWHLSAPVLVLVVALIFPFRKSLFRHSALIHRLAVGTTLVTVVTYTAGLAPTGSYYLSGWLRGMADSVTPGHSDESRSVVTRGPAVELERSNPDRDVLALASYLGETERRSRPVVYYGPSWGLGIRVGAPSRVYPTDDVWLSDAVGLIVRRYLEDQQDAIVIMGLPTYASLFHVQHSGEGELAGYLQETPVKKALAWLSSVHFAAAPIEQEARSARWGRTVGAHLRANYRLAAELGNLAVLEPNVLALGTSRNLQGDR